ncbi:MAG TPA: CBS domain-containing protein [Candidatus Dormibacteraeota bacterium]|nr:CBS domain-containing protein [Candidatus Dormibacteraeota bacterium]
MTWTVDRVMTRRVVAVQPTTGYKEIARLMAQHHVSAVPVVDVVGSEGKLVGIVSEADLLAKEEAAGTSGRVSRDPRAEGRTAADLMTRPAITIRSDGTVARAARSMLWDRVRLLPVVDPEGRLVGIVSRSDLLKIFLRSDESIRDEVQRHVLADQLGLEPDALDVSVSDGVVTLQGEAESAEQASRAVAGARGVEGVVGVDDRLTWPAAGPSERRQRAGRR